MVILVSWLNTMTVLEGQLANLRRLLYFSKTEGRRSMLTKLIYTFMPKTPGISETMLANAE